MVALLYNNFHLVSSSAIPINVFDKPNTIPRQEKSELIMKRPKPDSALLGTSTILQKSVSTQTIEYMQ